MHVGAYIISDLHFTKCGDFDLKCSCVFKCLKQWLFMHKKAVEIA